MDDGLQNANPAVLNASDLPSRRRDSTSKQRKDGGTGLLDAMLPAYSYPYTAFDFSPPSSPSLASSSDEESIEDIDEQEIYGTSPGLAWWCLTPTLTSDMHRSDPQHFRPRAPSQPGRIVGYPAAEHPD